MKSVSFPLALIALVAISLPRAAHAEPGFAQPPDDAAPDRDDPPGRAELVYDGHDRELATRDFEPRESGLRISTGPALRAMSSHADGGFGAALDVGARAAGARFAGTWVRVGSDRGLSQYDAQLWIDFGASERLHPILGAGAGVARLETASTNDGVHAAIVGIGSLRGSLEYVLPLHEADARAGFDVIGALPAIHGTDAPSVAGWVLVSARVGIGF